MGMPPVQTPIETRLVHEHEGETGFSSELKDVAVPGGAKELRRQYEERVEDRSRWPTATTNPAYPVISTAYAFLRKPRNPPGYREKSRLPDHAFGYADPRDPWKSAENREEPARISVIRLSFI